MLEPVCNIRNFFQGIANLLDKGSIQKPVLAVLGRWIDLFRHQDGDRNHIQKLKQDLLQRRLFEIVGDFLQLCPFYLAYLF